MNFRIVVPFLSQHLLERVDLVVALLLMSLAGANWRTFTTSTSS